jgi:FixJ family two-component response regulator
MIPIDAKVLILDDDAGFRHSMERFLRSIRIAVQTFQTVAEFLAYVPDDGPACVLLDLQMPEMSGLEIQKELARLGRSLPVVFLTGHGGISAGVQAMKFGAVDFLEKPFDERRLCEAIERALSQDVQMRNKSAAQREARRRLSRLTAREHQVCDYVMAGLLNKQSAGQIGIAESTVKVHRSRMMKKLGVTCVVELIRLVDTASGRWPADGSSNGNGPSYRGSLIDESDLGHGEAVRSRGQPAIRESISADQ